MCSFAFIILSIQMSHFLLRLLPTVSLCKYKQNSSNESEVAQSCPTLCDLVDCSPPGSSVYGILQEEYWSGLPFPSPGDLPESWIKSRSPALQVDALTSEPPGKPITAIKYIHASLVSKILEYSRSTFGRQSP